MRLAETVTFGGSGLDRAAHLRGDADALALMSRESEALVLPIWRGKPLLAGSAPVLGWLAPDHPLLRLTPAPVFLGLEDAGPRWAADVSAWQPAEVPDSLGAFSDPSEQRHPDLQGDYRFAELRTVMAALAAREAELVATGKAILGWHRSHGFCSACGAASNVAMAGWRRDCPACGTHHFPRTDPVVIMLITEGNGVLLGRSPAWPDGMFSLLAGFVEPGETVEAAVRREVFEETGVRVGPVAYLASQPWPFPASLMLGCHGRASGRELTLDPNEIEAAMWLTREEVMEVFAGTGTRMKPPRAGAIAGFLLRNWVADRLD